MAGGEVASAGEEDGTGELLTRGSVVRTNDASFCAEAEKIPALPLDALTSSG